MMKTDIEVQREGEARPMAREVVEGTNSCPVCGTGGMAAFWKMGDLPVQCNALCSTREEALAVPRGDIHLAVCPACGYIGNMAFDPGRMAYDQAYENALHFSPRFRAYAEDLAKQIIETYDLHGKDILEVACGDGYFLRLLCKLGGNRGVGFDPSYTDRPSDERDPLDVSIIRDYYGERYAGQSADLICCRHALEHMPDPVAFLRTVRKTIGDRLETVVFFEVPNAMFILRDMSVWDIIYEHCCYFTIPSLTRCFRAAGFDVVDVREAYDGQFLTITARPAAAGKPPDAIDELSVGHVVSAARAFADGFSQKLDGWAKQFETLAAGKRKAVLWGAGSKGITILNMLQLNCGSGGIDYVIDINSRKQGKFVAGTGQQIIGPEFLTKCPPDVVVVMNPVYEGEIRRRLGELDLSVDLLMA